MQSIIKAEELGMFLLSIFVFSLLDFAWWWFPVLILLPDLGMIGYIINIKAGAITYNVFHHKGIAIVVGALGYHSHSEILILAGVILFGHSSLDRLFGYGLKYFTGFKYTHLGKLK